MGNRTCLDELFECGISGRYEDIIRDMSVKDGTDNELVDNTINLLNNIENMANVAYNCNLTTCRYNENGKCTNEEKRKECVEVAEKVLVDRLSPSELLMHLSDGIGHTESLKKFGIEIDLSKFEDDKAEIHIGDFEDKLLTEIMEKHYKEFGLNEENRYVFKDVVEKYGDMTYRHLCENYCFAFEKE